jgi:hypothetical protein
MERGLFVDLVRGEDVVAVLAALDLASWGEVLGLLALGVLVGWGAVALLGRRVRRGGLREASAELALEEIRLREDGLREFSREVEARLDERLDRLEALVREADIILLRGPELLRRPEPFERSTPSFQPEEPAGGGSPEGVAITPHERERVIALARSGERPEAVAEAVGLRPGEVDLILRLHGGAESSPRST